MTLGIDLDGVCAKWYRGAALALNKRFELDIDEYGEPTHWDFLEESVHKKHWAWLWTAGVERGLFRHLKLENGAYEYLEKLTKEHDVHIITNRPVLAGKDTIAWLAEYLPFNFRSVTITKKKWEVKCDVYLDDKPENVIALRENRFTSYHVLFRRRYNEYLQWTPSVKTWSEFYDFVNVNESRLIS